MSGHRLRLLIYLLAFCALPAPAADRDWIKVSTPHFELYTNGGEGAAKRTLLYFEQIRSFFLEAMKAEEKDAERIRIVGFRNEKEYEPYRPNEVAAAFYLGGYDHDYIVIGNIGAESQQMAVHEYVHLLVRHAGLNLPPWMNEGLADLYSTLQPSGNKAKVGALLPSRYLTLKNSKWIPVERLLSVDHDSPEYNAKQHAGVFYSESWALVHMLNLSPEYRDKYPDFGAAMVQGATGERAIREVYGLSPEGLEKALRSYIAQQSFYEAVFDIKLAKSAAEAAVEQAPELEVGLVMGQLTASMRDKRDLARKTYEELAAKYPKAPEAPEALGYLAWRAGDNEEGRAQLARAAELGSTNPKMYYDLAYLSRADGGAEAAIAALERAVELDPEYFDAMRQLGALYLRESQWTKAILQLNKVTRVETNEQAYWLYHSRAFGYFQVGQMDESERLLELASKHAEAPHEKSAVESLRGAIEVRKQRGAEALADGSNLGLMAPGELERPTLSRREVATTSTGAERITEFPDAPSFSGKLTQFDCLEQGAVLHIDSDGVAKAFAIVDPTSIVIVSAGGGEAEFTCGAQDGRAIRVEFEPETAEGFEAEGKVTLIEFPE